MARELVPVDEQHLLRGARRILWLGGPPPDDDPYSPLLETFLEAFESSGSLRVARRQAGLLCEEVDRFLGQSPWFSQRVNAIVNERKREIVCSSINRAIGFVPVVNGNEPMTDQQGKVVYQNASDKMALFHMTGGASEAPTAAVAPPDEDALSVVRRQNGLLLAYPWSTPRPDGSWVMEVGQFNAGQMAKLIHHGIVLPNVPGLWFIEVAPDRKTVVAVRGRGWEPLADGTESAALLGGSGQC